ncbi:MAG: S-layer homology domain-containing protein [Syntrophomonas sp.]|nr:S-layer homology domain-containing protein [Syntrophomonas sp.]
MSREDLAVWLVNSLGYHDVAAIKNRIETPFKDTDQIAPDKANYVGLVEGLGLLGADENNYFHPQAAITWAEMANAAARLAARTHAGY